MDLYPEGHVKAEASKTVLQQMVRLYDQPISNANMADNVIRLARNCHDTLK